MREWVRGGAGVQARLGARESVNPPLAHPMCWVRWEGHRVREGLACTTLACPVSHGPCAVLFNGSCVNR